MSIKKVETIPVSKNIDRPSYRSMIRNDIQEAIDNRIDKFEFIGEYNYKYLQTYAKEEAQKWFRKFARSVEISVIKDFKQKYNTDYCYIDIYQYQDKFIKIHKVTKEDRIHVYAEIDFDILDNLSIILFNDAATRFEMHLRNK